MAGFADVFPLQWLQYFDERELEVYFRDNISSNPTDLRLVVTIDLSLCVDDSLWSSED